jgi:ribonuclease E
MEPTAVEPVAVELDAVEPVAVEPVAEEASPVVATGPENPVSIAADLPPATRPGSGVVTPAQPAAAKADADDEYDISGYDLSRYDTPAAAEAEPMRLTGADDPDAADDEDEDDDEPVGAGAGGRRRSRRGGTRRRTRP